MTVHVTVTNETTEKLQIKTNIIFVLPSHQ